MKELIRQLTRRKSVFLSAVSGIIIITVIACIILYWRPENDEQKETDSIEAYAVPKGYTEVIETMYLVEDSILKYADDENSKDGPKVVKNEVVKIVAVNEKSGWSILAFEDTKKTLYMYIRSDKLIGKSEWESIHAESESIAETGIITTEETTTNTESISNMKTNTVTETTAKQNTWIPVPSGWEDALSNQLLSANSSSDTNTYGDYMLHDPFAEPWREEHYRFLLADAFRFVQDQLDPSQTMAALQKHEYTYSDSVTYEDVQKAVRECIAVKFTTTGKDFNTIQQEITARTSAIDNKFLMIKVYYNGTNNTSTIWVVKCGSPTII